MQPLVAQYRDKNVSLKKCKYILIGDSHTFELKDYMPPRPDLVNIGIKGDTTRGILARLRENILSVESETAIIQIGYNDFKFRSLTRAVANYKTLLSRLPQKQVYLCSLFPVNGKRIITNNKIKLFNKEIESICAGSSRFKYVNIFDNLYDAGSRGINPAYTYDGVHLNAKGYAFFLKALDSVVQN